MPYKNKEDQARACKEHYEQNKSAYKLRAKVHKENHRIVIKNFINAYLLEHPCVDCGEKDTIVLEFDHVAGKKLFAISNAVQRAYGLKTIKDEIQKCEVRCANCHRIKTYQRRNNLSK